MVIHVWLDGLLYIIVILDGTNFAPQDPSVYPPTQQYQPPPPSYAGQHYPTEQPQVILCS